MNMLYYTYYKYINLNKIIIPYLSTREMSLKEGTISLFLVERTIGLVDLFLTILFKIRLY